MQHYPRPDGLPPTNGYSHAIAFSGRLVVVSGQVPLDADGQLVGKGEAEVQVRQVFRNIATALEAAGAGFANLVKLTYFLTDLDDLAAVRRVRDEFVPADAQPASSLVQVAGLVHPEFRIEIEAMAAV